VETIRSPREIERVFDEGSRAAHPLLVVFSCRSLPEHHAKGRVVFVAPKKLGSAPLRNRCKRVLREACRRAGGPWAGWDVALMARPGVALASAADVDAALGESLAGVGLGAR
jgi:ribonuclease P protein component